jgi:hypothetical protein
MLDQGFERQIKLLSVTSLIIDIITATYDLDLVFSRTKLQPVDALRHVV